MWVVIGYRFPNPGVPGSNPGEGAPKDTIRPDLHCRLWTGCFWVFPRDPESKRGRLEVIVDGCCPQLGQLVHCEGFSEPRVELRGNDIGLVCRPVEPTVYCTLDAFPEGMEESSRGQSCACDAERALSREEHGD